ncbi:HNH endonuclease signature motif containing protein [Kutzneria sp. 744]|uniref:HNH endonuclease signature motif containing protein n=1 Tax=Kutzneria sp. (strain 744) TaxID=345341 RepID=UPI001E412D29|nr:HNH endonuclease signature motif containing protein [Kutzneria sp. 744]
MCAICKAELSTGIGYRAPGPNVAHIVALGQFGPRSDNSLSEGDKNALANLILLCPNCHDKVDKSPDHFTRTTLSAYKVSHENWASTLRAAGQAWNARFQTVDFVNLPRILALPGGEAIWEVAKDVGIDDERSFFENGARSGLFVARVQPIFETLNTRAIPLNAETVETMVPGCLVSFEANMRSSSSPGSAGFSPSKAGRATYPSLRFALDRKLVSIRFDPRWLTTNTAFADLSMAEEEDTVYTGIGTVVGVTDGSIRLSALVFGKPMTDEVTLFDNLLLESHSKNVPRSARVDDFAFRPPKWLADSTSTGIISFNEVPEDQKTTVALRFNEDAVLPDQIERMSFPTLLRTTREINRNLSVSIGSELLFTLNQAGIRRGRADRYPSMNVAALVVSDFPVADIPILHAAMRIHAPIYLELVEVDPTLPSDQILYLRNMTPRYRIAGSRLFLISPSHHRDDEWIEEWRATKIFNSVDWDEPSNQEETG